MEWKRVGNGDLHTTTPGGAWGTDEEVLIVARMSEQSDGLSSGQERAAAAIAAEADRLFAKTCSALELDAEMEVEIAWTPDPDEGGAEAASGPPADAPSAIDITSRFRVTQIQLPSDDEAGMLIVEGHCDWDEDGFMLALKA